MKIRGVKVIVVILECQVATMRISTLRVDCWGRGEIDGVLGFGGGELSNVT